MVEQAGLALTNIVHKVKYFVCFSAVFLPGTTSDLLHDLRPNFSTTSVRKSGSGGVKSSLLGNIAIHGLAAVVFARSAELCVLCISNYIETFPRNPSLLCINCSLTFHRWSAASLD